MHRGDDIETTAGSGRSSERRNDVMRPIPPVAFDPLLPTASPDAVDADLERRRDRLRPAVRRSFLTSVVSIVVFGGLLARFAPTGFGIWLGLRVAVSIGAVVALGRLVALARDGLPAETELRWLTRIMGVSGVVWGLVPVLVRPESPEWRAVVVLWLFGNQAVVTAVCAPWQPTFRAAIGSVTIVGAVALLSAGDGFSVVLAGILVLGGVYSISIFTSMHRTVNASIASQLETQALAAALTDRGREVEAANARLSLLASRDELTGLANRRTFGERLTDDDGTIRCDGFVGFVDLDEFKDVNDRRGHGAGDHVLRCVARRWVRRLPTDGVLARTGGDEFLVALPGADPEEADAVAETMRACLRDPIGGDPAGPIAVTSSIGITQVRAGEPLDAALARADAALYRAKREGRNQVCVAEIEDLVTA